MIALYTDFGTGSPYVGLLKAVLARDAPGLPIVDLLHDLPGWNIPAAAHLLAALTTDFPAGTVLLCVVDPGVGMAARPAWLVRADGRTLIGPGNGLFDVVIGRAQQAEVREITWRPARLSASFHGRDLFAPIAARAATGERVASRVLPGVTADGTDLAEVIYIDTFGNGMTGIRATSISRRRRLRVGGDSLGWARTFGERQPGAAFWYENSLGLVEIACNRGSAELELDLVVGTRVEVL